MSPVVPRMRAALSGLERPLYQTHTWAGEVVEVGLRGVERRALIDAAHVLDQHVVDFGCASGAETTWAAELGAASVVGIEHNEKYVPVVAALRDVLRAEEPLAGARVLSPIAWDLRHGVPTEAKHATVAFCFAITHHLGYRPLWKELPLVRYVYLEGGVDAGYTERSLSDAEFQATLIGTTPGRSATPNPRRNVFLLQRR